MARPFEGSSTIRIGMGSRRVENGFEQQLYYIDLIRPELEFFFFFTSIFEKEDVYFRRLD